MLSRMILGLALLGGGALWASESDELRARARAMRKEAAVLAERGDKDKAERLEREAVQLIEAAERMEMKARERGDKAERGDRPGNDLDVQRLKERLQDLLAKEKAMRKAQAPEKELAAIKEQIAGTEQKLKSVQSRQPGPGPGKIPPQFQAQAEKLASASRSIHHLRVAAENLKMAEAHDLARQLMDKSAAMERELEEAKKQLAAEIQKTQGADRGSEAIRELKQENERLRAEIRDLRQKLEKR
jgi:hypothetical protein